MKNDHFQTSDFTLAISLVTVGFVLTNLDKSNPSKVQFIFDRNSALDNTIQAYWSKQLKLEPQIFSSNQKMLKTRLYDN